ncbi:hypothetical protein PHIN9_03130 [Polynucleobacter sp. HIN9]|uniref:FkbM family methyltransferase n=1 Tax=Polynucleobacter sp. HIN9 TaxID=3047868 RepID=UPI0025734E3D|nr:FkbM family methyltransferase [Polynucleobacter sp. HIN9]BEI40382.1 hypothetical protein PHIN9_03130 [Polynucleobacter sp. HIN9]
MLKNLQFKIRKYGIRTSLKYVILTLLSQLKASLFNIYGQHSEDYISEKLLGAPVKFYIDIGANHPSRFSNTRRFYNKGAHGINIEPNPSLLKRFQKKRRRDLNLSMGVSSTNSAELDFYSFSLDTLSTFDSSVAQHYRDCGFKLQEVIKVPIISLEKIFQLYCDGVSVDLLTIDVEGYELNVLDSNNWAIYRPKLVVVEVADFESDANRIEQVTNFMNNVNYSLAYFNGCNSFYLRK